MEHSIPDLPEVVVGNIDALIAQQGTSRLAVARKTGTAPSSFYRKLNDRTLSVKDVGDIAAALDVDPAVLTIKGGAR